MNATESRKFAVFDLDFTLVNQNSYFDFVQYYLWNRHLFSRLWLCNIYVLTEKLGINFLFGKTKRAFYTDLLIGENKQDLEIWAGKYVTDRLVRFTNDDILAKYKELKSEDYETLLISASYDIIVRKFAGYYGFYHFIGSKFEYDKNHKFTGRFDHDVYQNKRQSLDLYLKSLSINLDYTNSLCYLDDQHDLGFLRKFKNGTGVVSDQLQEKFWQENNIPVLYIYPKVTWSRRVFLIPISYYLYSRYPSKELIFRYIPFFTFNTWWVSKSFSVQNLMICFFSWFGFMSMYEIGYLMNDFVSARKEKKGSLRVDIETTTWLDKYILTRIITFLLVSLTLYYLAPSLISRYLGASLLTMIFFEAHNRFVKSWRFVTFPVLKISRIVTPLLCLPVSLTWLVLAVAIFYMPVEIFYYIRKLMGKGEWDNSLRFRMIALPKLVIWLVVIVLNIVTGFKFAYFIWTGLALSIFEFGLIGKRILHVLKSYS